MGMANQARSERRLVGPLIPEVTGRPSDAAPHRRSTAVQRLATGDLQSVGLLEVGEVDAEQNITGGRTAALERGEKRGSGRSGAREREREKDRAGVACRSDRRELAAKGRSGTQYGKSGARQHEPECATRGAKSRDECGIGACPECQRGGRRVTLPSRFPPLAKDNGKKKRL